MSRIDASVVVCTYNRAELLRGAIESLAHLRTDGRFAYEILVVDNGSTDETPRVVEELARRSPVPLRSVREARPGVACARNCGVRAAGGAWIAFFDDDQVADADWLLELFGAAERTGARWVGGAVRLLASDSVTGELPAVCRRLLGESAPVEEPRRFGRKVFAGTGNLMVHRSVFDELGGFDESLHEAGEDTDLSRRIRAAGIEGWFVPSAVVRHVVPPYRLGRPYLRWTSLRNGMHLARRERQSWGRWGFPLILAARLGQAAAHFLPRWLWGLAVRSPRIRLEGRCLLWRTEGYLRLVLSWMLPARFLPGGLTSTVNFRTERELFA